MKRTFRRSQKPKQIVKQYRVNNQIHASTVRLIDEESEISEIIPLNVAIQRAEEAEQDLVEVSPNADPPVVRIMDYGRMQYQQEKMMKKQKAAQKKIDVKGIRLSARISQHDIDVRLKNAKKFLEKGDKVKIELILRGREHQHSEIAKKIIIDFIKEFGDNIIIEQPVKKMGSTLQAIIARKNN